MKGKDLTDLILIAAIWGSSFIFLRMSVDSFGPFALIALRTSLALAVLLPILLWQEKLPLMIKHWRPIFTVGIINAAIPFCLLAYAAINIPAGVLSILNASTPLWGATIAWVWFKDKLPFWRLIGLFIGFFGIMMLVWDEFELDAVLSSGLALGAGLLAPLSYGLSANYTKKHLMGTDPLAVATGSLISASIVLAPLAWLTWPTAPIESRAWAAVFMLALLCTAFTYIIFYRLIMVVGPAKASTVTFLIPIFGVLWGWLWLEEHVTQQILMGAGIIILGTALATGIVTENVWRRKFNRHS